MINKKVTTAVVFSWVVGLSSTLSGCAYQVGYGSNVLPGGYKQVAIPVFENLTQEVGIEAFFTNAITREFERSHAAKVVSSNMAPVTLEGSLEKVLYIHGPSVNGGSSDALTLPVNSVLTIEYRVIIHAKVRLIRNSDKTILWESGFKDERSYSAPQVGRPGVNGVNPLYNHSARLQNIALIADDMMVEAHDRMTENF